MRKQLGICLVFGLLLIAPVFSANCAGQDLSGNQAEVLDLSVPESVSAQPAPHLNLFINQVETDCPSDGNTEITALVSVIDEKGDLVDTLDLSNFQIAFDSNKLSSTEVHFAPAGNHLEEPVSVVIIMDYSTSITDFPEVQTAMEDAVAGFINLMQPGDQAEIIKFNTGIKYVQPFTENSALLKIAAEYTQGFQGGHTYLYDTLYKGVEDAAARPTRKAVIAITDGVERHEKGIDGNGRKIQDVITLARVKEVPLFIIGLGSAINPAELQKISRESSGHFFQADESDELYDIYASISKLLNNGQYVLRVEPSPDLTGNGALMVSVNYNGMTDSACAEFLPDICH